MNSAQYDVLRMVEDTHWWFRIRRRLALDALKPVRTGVRVLDAGCGTGGMLALLGRFEAHGCDISEAAAGHCRSRGFNRVLVADVGRMPYSDACFDAVTCLDVLYHENVNEARALEEMRRVLKKSGLLVVNVAAFECLRGSHDDVVHGSRRYTAHRLRALLSRHGFEVVCMSYWNAWLFLPLLVRRRLCHAPEGDLSVPPGMVNTVMAACGWLDARVCRALRWPWGTSVFAVARALS